MTTTNDRHGTLPQPLSEQLRPALDEAGVARVWRAVRSHGEAETRTRVRTRAVWAGAFALLSVAVLLVVVRSTGGEREVPGALRTAADRAPLTAVLRASVAPVALDDGSQMIIGAGSEMEILANDGGRFVTVLRRGSCHFAVKPGGPRRWTIETDLATVEVVGTVFTVRRSRDGLDVSVDRGVVLVHGERVPGRVARVRAGERFVLADPASAPAARAPSGAAATQPAVLPTGIEDAQEAPRRAVAEAPRGNARRDAPVAENTGDVDDAKFAAADAARAAGRFDDAARLFAEVMHESPNEPRGALAAFSLAKLELDQLGRPDRAADTFAWVVERGAPRGLVEDAQARRIEALGRAGRAEDAAAEARAYELRWPQGRRLTEVRALVQE